MIVSKTSVKIMDCCKPAEVLKAMKPDEKQVKVGMILGHAVDFIERANPTGGSPFIGFAGQFEVIPSNPTNDTLRSNNLFLPGGTVHDAVAAPLNKVLYPDAEKPEKKSKGVAVQFAAEIVLARSGDGFAWGVNFLTNPASVDPLETLRPKSETDKTQQPAPNKKK